MNIIATSLVLSCLTTGIIWKIKCKNNSKRDNDEKNDNEFKLKLPMSVWLQIFSFYQYKMFM